MIIRESLSHYRTLRQLTYFLTDKESGDFPVRVQILGVRWSLSTRRDGKILTSLSLEDLSETDDVLLVTEVSVFRTETVNKGHITTRFKN